MISARFSIILTLTAIIFLVIVNSARAQYTIKQVDISVPEQVVQKVAEDRNCSTSSDLASVPGSEYLQTAKKMGENLATEKITIRVDIKGLFAAENVGSDGKTSMVYNGMFNMIMWDQKKVIQISPEEIKGMAKQAEDMMSQMQKNMPDMSKLLDGANLTDEQKAAAMQAMPMFGGNKQVAKQQPTVKPTNDKRTILDMPANLYLVEDGSVTKGIWASDIDKKLAEKYREVSENFEAMSPMESNKTEWELIPGKYPLETVEVRDGGFRGPEVDLNLTREIKKGNPPASAYYVPGKADGFQVGGKELMMGGF